MPLEWLNADLMAGRKRSRTIEFLRAQVLEEGTPNVQTRLQLADLLVSAGRGQEAVPILLGLADEFAGEDFVAKAIAILKRVEKIDPGRDDVAAKLSALVEEQLRLTPTALIPERRSVEIGMEEIGEPSDRELAGQLPVARGLRDAELVDEDDDEAVIDPSLADEVDEVVQILVDTTDAGSPDEAEAEESPAAAEPQAGVGGKIRGAFRRFLAALPGPAEAEPTAGEGDAEQEVPTFEASDLAESSDEAGGTESTQDQDQEEGGAAEADTEGALAEAGAGEPATQAAETLPSEASLDRAFAPGRRGQPPPEPQLSAGTVVVPETNASDEEIVIEVQEGETLSDEAYQDRVLDLVEDVLHKAPRKEPKPTEALEKPPDVGSRLLASPLFVGLSKEEMLTVVEGLELRTFGPGEVLVTEGEPGQSLFMLASGSAKVFVRNAAGHDMEVTRLAEGEFFGEISALSGKPRTATVTATVDCEALELERPVLDAIARQHPRVKEKLEAIYIERAENPDVAAVRAVDLNDVSTKKRATEILRAHFGESRWDPRMRLRLSEVLLRAGKAEDAVPILAGLADDLAKAGYPEKAIAILKKIERIQSRHVEEVNLAPLSRKSAEASERKSSRPPRAAAPSVVAPEDAFRHWLVEVVRETVEPAPGPSPISGGPEDGKLSLPRGFGPGLASSPLFEGFSEDELVALIRGLRLVSFRSGDIVISEGESGQSLFILASGSVRVMIRDHSGHNTAVCQLSQGAFFGEIATLSGRPRSATVTAAEPCELLELERDALLKLVGEHPRMLEVLKATQEERSQSPEAARIRGGGASTAREESAVEGGGASTAREESAVEGGGASTAGEESAVKGGESPA